MSHLLLKKNLQQRPNLKAYLAHKEKTPLIGFYLSAETQCKIPGFIYGVCFIKKCRSFLQRPSVYQSSLPQSMQTVRASAASTITGAGSRESKSPSISLGSLSSSSLPISYLLDFNSVLLIFFPFLKNSFN